MSNTRKEHYFELPVTEQAHILHSLAPQMGRRAEILEKNIWLRQLEAEINKAPYP